MDHTRQQRQIGVLYRPILRQRRKQGDRTRYIRPALRDTLRHCVVITLLLLVPLYIVAICYVFVTWGNIELSSL